MKNNSCDKDLCRDPKGQVRLLPTGGDSNMIVCHVCFDHEIRYRIDRNKELGADCQFKLPTWESLEVYRPE